MYWDPQACHWDMLGTVAPVLGHAGVHSPSTGMCWDMLGSVAPALGCAGIHNPSTGCYWVPNFCTRTCWDPGLLYWSLLWGPCAILGTGVC